VVFVTVLRFAKREPVRQTVSTITPRPTPVGQPPSLHRPIAANDKSSPLAADGITDELCGVGGANRLRTGGESIEEHAARVSKAAISKWQSVLLASDDFTSQAIGLALQNPQPPQDTPVTNNLVLLAIQSDNPAIYALALGQCWDTDYAMSAGPCQGLSWEHWSNIDPDNAMPWLWIAARDLRTNDADGVDQALAKAAAARRLESYAAEINATALAALPGETTPLEKAVAGSDLASTIRIVTPMAMFLLCSQSATQKPLRRSECSSIATAIAKQGSTQIELRLASVLADRLELPQDLRDALQVESKNAWSIVQTYYPVMSPQGGGARFHCDHVSRSNTFIDALEAAHGSEREALAAISRSLKSR
jgi:hypothetical protein